MSKILINRISSILLVLFLISASALSAYAAEDYSTNAASGDVQTVNSPDELEEMLMSDSCTIQLGRGSWSVRETIRIPAGFTVDLNSQTVQSSVDYPFILDGNGASITNGTIRGGGVKVSSNDPNGYISDLNILNASQHGIWVLGGAIGNITGNTVTSPSFIGICLNGGSVKGNIADNTLTGCGDSSRGSIMLNSYSAVSGKITGNTILDGAGMGIYMYSKCSSGAIENNTIKGCADHAIRLVGNSSASSNDGCTAGDIAHNTISDCKGHGISLYSGSHCGKITYNDLKNIGGASSTGDFAIIVNAGSCYKTYAKEVTHNTIDGVTMAGIVAFSGPVGKSTKKYQDFGYIQGDIAYNTILHSGTFKRKVNWKKPKKSDPVCEGAIYIDCHARVFGSIHDNTINSSYDDGINVLAYSTVSKIYNNTIKNARNAGIAVKNYSKASSIYNNKISGAGRYGILINSSSKVTGKIYKNKITKPAETGLAVLQKSTVKTFTQNKISDAGLYGILAGGSGSKIQTVSSNTISTNNNREGYPVFCNTRCLIAKITGNTLSGKYLAGIRVKQPSGKITVKSNKITSKNPSSSKSTGMSVDGCKKGISITSNKITGNGNGPGIYIKTSSSSINKNKFKKVTSKIYR